MRDLLRISEYLSEEWGVFKILFLPSFTRRGIFFTVPTQTGFRHVKSKEAFMLV